MILENKYAELINAVNAGGATNVVVRTQDRVLYIDGVVPTGEAKDMLWGLYDKLDPDFRSGDLVLNLDVSPPTLEPSFYPNQFALRSGF